MSRRVSAIWRARVLGPACALVAGGALGISLGASGAEAAVRGPFMGCTTHTSAPRVHVLKRRPRRCGWWPVGGYAANSGWFRSIRWSSWNRRRASARAVAYGVQMNTHWHTHVRIRLSRPVTCSGEFRLFTRMTVRGPYGTGRLARMRCSDIAR